MFSKLHLSFRTKIFLVLGAIVFLSIATVLLVLQQTTKNRVEENIKKRFDSTIYAFRELQELRIQFASDEINSLTMGDSHRLALVRQTPGVTEGFGFGAPT